MVKALCLDQDAAIVLQQRPREARKLAPGTPLYGSVMLDGEVLGHENLRALQADTTKAVAYYIMESGQVQLAYNPLFTACFMTQTEACEALGYHKMLPIFLWGILFTPASQLKLYTHLSEAVFGADPLMLVLECVGRDGEKFLGRTTLRHKVAGGGAHAACVLTIEMLGREEAATHVRAEEMEKMAAAGYKRPRAGAAAEAKLEVEETEDSYYYQGGGRRRHGRRHGGRGRPVGAGACSPAEPAVGATFFATC